MSYWNSEKNTVDDFLGVIHVEKVPNTLSELKKFIEKVETEFSSKEYHDFAYHINYKYEARIFGIRWETDAEHQKRIDYRTKLLDDIVDRALTDRSR